MKAKDLIELLRCVDPEALIVTEWEDSPYLCKTPRKATLGFFMPQQYDPSGDEVGVAFHVPVDGTTSRAVILD